MAAAASDGLDSATLRRRSGSKGLLGLLHGAAALAPGILATTEQPMCLFLWTVPLRAVPYDDKCEVVATDEVFSRRVGNTEGLPLKLQWHGLHKRRLPLMMRSELSICR